MQTFTDGKDTFSMGEGLSEWEREPSPSPHEIEGFHERELSTEVANGEHQY
jgi:hypothetical protein